MKKITLLLMLLYAYTAVSQATFIREKRDNNWRFGIATYLGGPPILDSKLFFEGDSIILSYVISSTWFLENNAMMCDTSGKLLFSTNGMWVVDSTEQKMPNGDTISSNYHPLYYDTLNEVWDSDYYFEDYMIQGCLALPDPGNAQRYYLLHARTHWYGEGLPNTFANEAGKEVYYSVIDMTEHGGLGDIIEKRTELLDDTLAGFTPRLKACRHANGRDWWIPIGLFPNKYKIYLLDPTGFHLVNEQTIDYNEYYGSGQAVFSPDGTKYARLGADTDFLESFRVHLFEFDRCEGIFTDDKLIEVPLILNQEFTDYTGLSFSPNSRFLYINNAISLYQIDLWETSPSAELIAQLNPSSESFSTSTLGPADKIYIFPYSYSGLHIVNYPDMKGDSCGFCEHCFHVPQGMYGGVPNFAEYRTGPLDGSSCDTLGINMLGVVSVSPSPFKQKEVSVQPNPAVDLLRVLVADDVGGLLQFELYDGMGRRVLEQGIAKDYNAVYISNQPTGLYFWVAKDALGHTVTSGKVSVVR